MACPANVGVQDKGTKGIISYDIPTSHLNGQCIFNLKPEGELQCGIFQIKVNDEVIRENISKPFEAGSIKISSQNKSKKKDSYIVEVSKAKEFNLKKYFD